MVALDAAMTNLDLFDIGSEQSQGCEGGRANGEALTCSSGGVAKSVERIRAVTYLFAQTTHLCITTSIVGDRTVCISSQRDTQRREHSYSSDTDAIETMRKRV